MTKIIFVTWIERVKPFPTFESHESHEEKNDVGDSRN